MISALCVIVSRNAVVSIMYMILLYVNVSIYLFYTGLGVLGLIYILVYVGAIAILFLFILSLINIKISELSIVSNRQDYILILLSVVTLGLVLSSGFDTSFSGALATLNGVDTAGLEALPLDVYNVISIGSPATGADLSSYSELKVIGEQLFTEYSVPLLITGVILLLTILGVIILTK